MSDCGQRNTASLAPVDTDVWAAETSLRFFGFPLRARMVALRLPDGGLWLHSPIELDKVRAGLDALGPVRWRVAPNLLHHLYQAPYQTAYPDSRLWAPPGLAAKRPDLRIDHDTAAPVPAEWGGVVERIPVAGNTVLSETVYFHRPSRSLLVSDLLLHVGPWDHWSVRLYARLNRFYGVPGLSFGLKSFFRDRKAARRSIDAILDWDFRRLILAHGPILEQDARQAFRQAFAWLK